MERMKETTTLRATSWINLHYELKKKSSNENLSKKYEEKLEQRREIEHGDQE